MRAIIITTTSFEGKTWPKPNHVKEFRTSLDPLFLYFCQPRVLQLNLNASQTTDKYMFSFQCSQLTCSEF